MIAISKLLRDGEIFRRCSVQVSKSCPLFSAQCIGQYRCLFIAPLLAPTHRFRGLDCPLTEVSHLYAEGGIVWLNSVTSTTTDKNATLATFGAGAGSSGYLGTFIEMRVRNAKKVHAFSAFPSEEELLLAPNTCAKVLVTLCSAKVSLLQGLANLPPDVDLIVMQEGS